MNTKPEATPVTRAELNALIIEWYEAQQDAIDHFTRYPESEGVDLRECSDEIQADWRRANSRQEDAKDALGTYARATLAAQRDVSRTAESTALETPDEAAPRKCGACGGSGDVGRDPMTGAYSSVPCSECDGEGIQRLSP